MARPSNLRFKINADYVAAIAVAIAPLIYFWPALREGRALSPDDGVIFNIPLRVAAANLVRSGYLPLWNPFIFSGLPLHGAAQAGLLYPLNWFYVISSPRVATNLMMLSTYMVAGIGAYLYARRAGADIAGAFATSLIWQWCAFMVEQIGHTNILHTAAMVPWLLWAIDGYIATGERKRGVLFAALLALQVFAGHQQTLVYSLLLVAAYAFVIARTSPQTRKRFSSVAIFIGAGFALAAVQILPTFELLRNSLRATATYEFLTSFSMPPRFVLTFLAPYVLGGGNGLLFRAPYTGSPFFSEYVAYTGVLTIMLALVALLLKRDARTKFWAVVFVVALLLAFGRFLPFSFYKVIYYVPILNLFRDPARHLMEVEFALAVLAGRGLTAVRSSRDQTKITLITVLAGGIVLLLTCLTVTWWRPAAFHLAVPAPVTVLRAPELFIPMLLAGLSAWSLWVVMRSNRSRATVFLLAVLALDLIVYGQGSGWRTHSPPRDYELWGQPEAIKFLRQREAPASADYRVLTQDVPFDPNLPVAAPTPPSDLVLSLQPNTYMMHGIANAGGYDGFGLARYSRLAGDMKVWGEFPDADSSLRGPSREIDLLNVRYLIARRASVTSAATNSSLRFAAATKVYGGQRFGEEDLNVPSMTAGQRLSFYVGPIEIDRIALLTNLSWSNDVPDHAVVARINLVAADGRTFEFDLRAGDHTSEWSYDRPDMRSRIKHSRAPVATGYEVADAGGKYEAHTYVCMFELPQKTVVTSGEVTTAPVAAAPELRLGVSRITLGEGDQAFPVSAEMLGSESPAQPAKSDSAPGPRWEQLAQLNDVEIFGNNRALPRAWIADEALVLSDQEMLQVIRSGKLPDGRVWDPRRVALVQSAPNLNPNSIHPASSVESTDSEPNRIVLKTKSTTPSILVLSENHYPGWRAYLDGQNVDVMRVDYGLRGVLLPAGTHEVRFVFRPKSFWIGFSISLLTALALTGWSLGPWLRRHLGT